MEVCAMMLYITRHDSISLGMVPVVIGALLL